MSLLVHLITTNQKKLDTAKKVLDKYNVNLEMLKLDYEIPEIQEFECSKIAAFCAKFASEKTQKPVLVTDVGYFITALNGFPGPFAKQINYYLTSEDILKLMEGKTDRSFVMTEVLAFCKPSFEPVIFESKSSGIIAKEAFGNGTSIDRIVIRNGMEKVQTAYSYEEMIEYYSKKLDHWDQFGKYYQENLS